MPVQGYSCASTAGVLLVQLLPLLVLGAAPWLVWLLVLLLLPSSWHSWHRPPTGCTAASPGGYSCCCCCAGCCPACCCLALLLVVLVVHQLLLQVLVPGWMLWRGVSGSPHPVAAHPGTEGGTRALHKVACGVCHVCRVSASSTFL